MSVVSEVLQLALQHPLDGLPAVSGVRCAVPQRAKGMNGELLLVGGEANPPVIPAPFDLGEDLTV